MADDTQGKTGMTVGTALAAATCGLLGIATPATSSAADESSKWDIDSALLYYGESDRRVKDFSLSSHATRAASLKRPSRR